MGRQDILNTLYPISFKEFCARLLEMTVVDQGVFHTNDNKQIKYFEFRNDVGVVILRHGSIGNCLLYRYGKEENWESILKLHNDIPSN
jgi:hypothetical protein